MSSEVSGCTSCSPSYDLEDFESVLHAGIFLNFYGHHRSPSFEDHSSPILRQYGPPRDLQNLSPSEAAKIQKSNRAQYISHIPKGFASIPDTLQLPPKPHPAKRCAITLGLIFFHLVTWSIQFFNWVLTHIFGYSCRQKKLYKELHHIATVGNTKTIEAFLTKHAEAGDAIGFLFKELLSLPELYDHLPEILKGANVCFCKDNGFFCNRWKEHPSAHRRISSHQYLGQECYAISHFLFWRDPAGNTRFQLEKSPFRGFFNAIDHIIDYLHYQRDNEQQGLTGASPFTETHCLTLPIDPDTYLARQPNPPTD